jgi:hypothetical protein
MGGLFFITLAAGSGVQSARGADLCDGCHRSPNSGESRLAADFVVHLGVVGRSVMVSITTMIVFMLAAALVVAGLL